MGHNVHPSYVIEQLYGLIKSVFDDNHLYHVRKYKNICFYYF